MNNDTAKLKNLALDMGLCAFLEALGEVCDDNALALERIGSYPDSKARWHSLGMYAKLLKKDIDKEQSKC